MKDVDAAVKADIEKCGVPHMTFDNWTSCGNVNYIAVCAHYIDDQLRMCDRCIVVKPYKASHSAEDMRE